MPRCNIALAKNSDNSPAKRAMNKTRQQELTRWLKQQSVISQRWLMISRLLGFVSGVLIVAQAWIMARILQHMIMENIPREALLLPFVVLVTRTRRIPCGPTHPV